MFNTDSRFTKYLYLAACCISSAHPAKVPYYDMPCPANFASSRYLPPSLSRKTRGKMSRNVKRAPKRALNNDRLGAIFGSQGRIVRPVLHDSERSLEERAKGLGSAVLKSPH